MKTQSSCAMRFDFNKSMYVCVPYSKILPVERIRNYIGVKDEIIVNKPGSRKKPEVELQVCPELIPPMCKYRFVALLVEIIVTRKIHAQIFFILDI